MNMKITFEDWLNNYGPRSYKTGTVKRYITALEKAPERMGISLPKPIMEYTDPEEYGELYNSLVSHEKYDYVNQNYGNRDLGAALNAYKKYVLFLSKMADKYSSKTVYSPEWFYEVAQSDKLKAFDEEAQHLRQQFVKNFGVESISALSGKELLTKLFYSDVENKENLCYTLEFHPKMREVFGSIAGGSAFKFGLFFHKKNRRLKRR